MADTMRLTDGSTTINFNSEVGFKTPNRFDIKRHVALSGKEYSYRYHGKGSWEVPLDLVSEADAIVINGWHSNISELTYTPDLINYPSTTHQVRIHNGERPLPNARPPLWADNFQGTLALVEI